jgi:hypothetical protein
MCSIHKAEPCHQGCASSKAKMSGLTNCACKPKSSNATIQLRYAELFLLLTAHRMSKTAMTAPVLRSQNTSHCTANVKAVQEKDVRAIVVRSQSDLAALGTLQAP